jgi:hypothetical protein
MLWPNKKYVCLLSHVKHWFIWQNGFRGKDFLEIDQSETRIACGGHVY